MSDTAPILPPAPRPEDRSPEDAAVIARVLRDVAPKQCAVAGAANVEDVAFGTAFADNQGGRHLNLLAIVESLGALAALVHHVIEVVRAWRGHAEQSGAQVEQLVTLIRQRYAAEPAIAKLLQENPTGLEKIVSEVVGAIRGK